MADRPKTTASLTIKPKHTADERLASIAEWLTRAEAVPSNKDGDGAWQDFGDADLDACVDDTRWMLFEIARLKAENAALVAVATEARIYIGTTGGDMHDFTATCPCRQCSRDRLRAALAKVGGK